MNFNFKKSLTWRIVFYVLTLCALIFLGSLTLFYLFSKKQLEQITYKNTTFITENTVLKIEQILTPIMKIAHNYKWMMLQVRNNPDSIAALTQKLVASNSEIMGSAIAFVPNYFPQKGTYFAPYSFKSGDSIHTIQLGNENYDYFYMDWFQIPTSIQKPYWTEPYYDTGGANALMTTFSIPITIDSDRVHTTIAVLTVDLALDWFTEIVSAVKVLESGYASVISKAGTFITHPKKELIMNQTIFSYAKEQENEELREIGRDMQTKKNGFANSTLNGVHRMIYYTSLPSSNWTLAVVFPKSEIYLPLRKITIILIVLIVIALSLLTIIISKVIQNQLFPLTLFSRSARQIATGDFQAPIPLIKTQDELLELHDAFHYMQENLTHYIESLKKTTSAKEKMESELRIAREIQMGMIPKTFPPFPNRKEIEQYASLTPAKEVGGDLYDYFIDHDKLYFIIGDVSGKGIPASLLMAVTRSLFRSITLHYEEPASILINLNNSLAENNDSNMFVTLFLGILHLNTGVLQFCNAGHNPPVMIHQNTGFLDLIPNLPLGLMEGFQYKQQELIIEKGTTMLLYTDGLTEAENHDQKLYGETRLLKLVSEIKNISIQGFVETILDDVKSHVETAEQSDDLTLLAIKYHGPAKKYEKSITLLNEIDQIKDLQHFVETVGLDLNLNSSLIMNLNLALEEAVSNVILYAYPKIKGKKIIVSVSFKGNDLVFTITDTGIPFDPTLIDNPNLELSAEERPIGGLGIFLIKQIMNEVTYSRIHDVNVFTMKKKLDPSNNENL